MLFCRDIDIEKVLASNKISFVEINYKYFIGYLHNGYKIRPLHTTPPKTEVFVKIYDGQTKWMYFFD